MNITHSIWLDDEDQSKLYINDPTVEVVNSDIPILDSKKTIDLPPLPPTSYFQQTLDEMEYNRRKNEKSSKLKVMFKKLSLTDKPSPAKERKPLRRKISTPFDFSHVGHVSHEPIAFDPSMMSATNIATSTDNLRSLSAINTTTNSTVSNSTGSIPYSPTEKLPSPTLSFKSATNNQLKGAVAFNTTQPTTSDVAPALTGGAATATATSTGAATATATGAAATSIVRHPSAATQDTASSTRFPRSASNSTSLSSHIFTRSGSISTLATSLSRSKSKGQSNSNSRLNSWQQLPKDSSGAQSSTPNSNASSPKSQKVSFRQYSTSPSIEDLKKFEKEQISKLCSPNNQPYLDGNDQPGFEAWMNSDSDNMGPQSSVQDEPNTSPLSIKNRSRKNSCKGGSPSNDFSSTKKSFRRSVSTQFSERNQPHRPSADIELFQSQMQSLFVNKTEVEHNQMLESIEDYKQFFINSIEEEDKPLPEGSLYRCSSTPLISSSSSTTSFSGGNAEELSQSSKQGSVSSYSQDSSQVSKETEETLEDCKPTLSKSKFYLNSIETTDLLNRNYEVSDLAEPTKAVEAAESKLNQTEICG